MPVSPQDFELYSRMTGAPMPSDAMSRMQMAPEVYEFTKNFARRPNLLQQTGNLLKNIGKGAVMAVGAPMIAESFAEQARIDEELRNEKDKIEAEAVTTNNSEVEDSPAMKKIRLQMKADALKHQYKLELQDRMDARALGKSTGGSGVVQTDLSTQPSTTANNYGQRVITSSTSQNIRDKQLENYEQMEDNIPNVAEVLATSEESQPAALYGTNPLDVPLLRSEDYGSGITPEQRIEFLKRDKLDKVLKGVLGESTQQGNSSDEYIPIRSVVNTGATVNLNPRRQEIENNVRKTLATLPPDQQAKVVDKIISGGNFKTGTAMTPETEVTPSVSDRGDKFLEDLTKEAVEALSDRDVLMDKPSFSYPTTRAGRKEVGLTEGGDIYQIFQKEPEKTYITRATPRQAEMFQEMLPDHLTEDRKKTPGAGGFLTSFTNKTFDF